MLFSFCFYVKPHFPLSLNNNKKYQTTSVSYEYTRNFSYEFNFVVAIETFFFIFFSQLYLSLSFLLLAKYEINY